LVDSSREDEEMADAYIDQFETLIYGKFAREQMKEVCIGRVPELDAAIEFAISAQQVADEAMSAALANQPRDKPVLATSEALAEARDVIVRFGSYLGSLKGRPVDPRRFFGGEAPSVLARRRITKLVAAVENILKEIDASGDKIANVAPWRDELQTALTALTAVEKGHRASQLAQADLAPAIRSAREQWLSVYGANKSLVRGLLAHAGKEELMPLVFDDLAETHRTVGTTEGDGTAPAPQPAKAP
jgi:hypothetical protein